MGAGRIRAGVLRGVETRGVMCASWLATGAGEFTTDGAFLGSLDWRRGVPRAVKTLQETTENV